jgi:hypothetical protein
MPRPVRTLAAAGVLCLSLFTAPLAAQDLDPRAYVHVPVNGWFFVGGFAWSEGGVLTDPALAITDMQATVETPSVGVGRSFSLFGKTAQAFGVLPYTWAQATGRVFGEAGETTRSGLSDMRIRLSVLVRGAPAASVMEFAKAPRRTVLGTSLTVVAPTGQFSPGRLINLGTNRWAFKPEVAVSRPMGQRWLLDLYGGLWLFTTNHAFYPGTASRSQAPMGSFQAHVSYSFTRQSWVAVDTTYYVGGQSTVPGVEYDDRQNNLRMGSTLVLPIGTRHSVKLALSRGAVVRAGSDFTSISVGWQTAWLPLPRRPGE